MAEARILLSVFFHYIYDIQRVEWIRLYSAKDVNSVAFQCVNLRYVLYHSSCPESHFCHFKFVRTRRFAEFMKVKTSHQLVYLFTHGLSKLKG